MDMKTRKAGYPELLKTLSALLFKVDPSWLFKSGLNG